GIPTKDLDGIFDIFQSSGNVKKTEGTGLGLTMARLMVELHGGRIWAESWRQMGASFYFSIPIAAQDMTKKINVYPKPVEYSGINGSADAGIPFAGMSGLLKALGFSERIRGSHHIFHKDGVEEIINLQPKGSHCKPYQVKQVREILKKYRLGETNDPAV